MVPTDGATADNRDLSLLWCGGHLRRDRVSTARISSWGRYKMEKNKW